MTEFPVFNDNEGEEVVNTGRKKSAGKKTSPIMQREEECRVLAAQKTRGALGREIARIVVLAYSPRDIKKMQWNFSSKIHALDTRYRKHLEESIMGFFHGTYQQIMLMRQQGAFSPVDGSPVSIKSPSYWRMVATNCRTEDEERDRLRYLKFLIAGFCMLVLEVPGHPVGMEFPGGDRVELSNGVYYCPVRTKSGDIDAALCPFCPAEQTPETGYLRPPLTSSRNRQQEYVRTIYDSHHFNG